MADEAEYDGSDAAAEAFEEVRGEVALLRRAIERLAAERAELPEQPDYSETLGRIANATVAAAQRLDALSKAAEDGIAPRYVADRIIAASSGARAEDQRTIAAARQGLEDATRALHGLVASARRSDEQNRWLAWSAIGGVVLGMLLWAVFAGFVARAVPESWLWPERMAARTLRLDTWTASRRLAAVSQPETWNKMVAGGIVVQNNREAIDRCRRAASKASEPVKCTVKIAAERPE